MSQLRCVVVTPERTVLSAEAQFVALPLFDGELGVAPGHSPMIGRLGFGELRLDTEEGTQRYYVEGGFVEVAADNISVLTGRAVPAAKVDELAARQALDAARQKPAHSPELMAIRDRAVNQARAQIQVARRAPRAHA
ncbi:MAG: ATP synthase F1 subunit epsilon [Thermoguttaceae bacterium]